MSDKRIFIAIPCSTPYMHTAWVIQFLNQYSDLKLLFHTYGSKDDMIMAGIHNHPNLPTNRNELAMYAFDKSGPNATHILFLDSDIVMPDGALESMLKRDLPIQGHLCFTKKPDNPQPIIEKDGKVLNPFPEGVIDVDYTGTGCLLIKKEVFAAIADLPEYKQNGNRFFVYHELWNGKINQKMSEDRYFCMLARKAGYKIYVDTTKPCEHLGIARVGLTQYNNKSKAGLKLLNDKTETENKNNI